MTWMINPASELVKCILKFFGIPCQEEVVVSSEVRVKGAEKGLKFSFTSTIAFWVRDLELVSSFLAS